RLLAGQGGRLAQSGLREEPAARRVRARVEVADQYHRVAPVSRLDVLQHDARRRQPRLTADRGGHPPGQVRVVEAQGPATGALAQAHPGAGALDPAPGAGRLVGRLFQPEDAVGLGPEAIPAKEDGAVLALVAAVVAANTDALVPGQRLLQEGDLFR